ncbi:MAG TPA: GNAT family N-acetyltransferase [Acidimicrobiales bacterium]|jgi:ribosomal protein S18 acetylase RimI-like enzyme|nr:GNAT family N-acetyltransferase [Acidimicrobiales bacterium]
MEIRSLGFRTDLAVLELGGSRIEDHGGHLIVRTPHNPAFWWGNFLLLPSVPEPAQIDGWLARFAAAFPEAAHIAVGIDDPAGTRDDAAGFLARAFDLDFSEVMIAGQVGPPATLTSDAICRQLHSDSDWQQSVELHIRCGDEPASATAEYRRFATAKAASNRSLVGAGHGGWFGAFIDDRLVAHMGLIRVAPDLARFQTVGTDPDFRRRGLAGMLVHHAGRVGLTEWGAKTLVMVADPDYFAIDLYRSLGFVTAESQLQIARRPPGG